MKLTAAASALLLSLTIVAIVWIIQAHPATTTSFAALNDGERQAFRDQVRAYLMDSPEVLLEAIAVLEQRQPQDQSASDSDLILSNVNDLFSDGYSFVGGNPDGDITMVEFLDYRCTFCRRAHPEVAELIATDGNIRYIIKEFPILGDQSVLASRFAMSVLNNAGPEFYAELHGTLMTFRGSFTLAALERLSDEMGLDTALIMAGMDAEPITTMINRNRALAQRMQITGTPGFIMGDQVIRGYVPLGDMQQIVATLRQ